MCPCSVVNNKRWKFNCTSSMNIDILLLLIKSAFVTNMIKSKLVARSQLQILANWDLGSQKEYHIYVRVYIFHYMSGTVPVSLIKYNTMHNTIVAINVTYHRCSTCLHLRNLMI